MSAESLCSHFQTANCSCNWAIGFDGRVAEIVKEGDRSWCSSSPANDHRAVTIGCASDAFYPYAINANVWKTLPALAFRYGRAALVGPRRGVFVLSEHGQI